MRGNDVKAFSTPAHKYLRDKADRGSRSEKFCGKNEAINLIPAAVPISHPYLPWLLKTMCYDNCELAGHNYSRSNHSSCYTSKPFVLITLFSKRE